LLFVDNMDKERIDRLLVERGLVETREKARALVMAGLVFCSGKRVEKPGMMIERTKEIVLKERMPYVSRGGLKLEEALDSFQIRVKGMVAADLGASTGGFTDCLLQRGARKVYAVDVDTTQLDWKLRRDVRVVMIEKNARYLKREDFGDRLDLVTVDLSFISILKVLPALKSFVSSADILVLLKPQFEAGKGKVGKKGIISDPQLHEQILKSVVEEVMELGFGIWGLMKPSLRGQRGNQEFFLHLRYGESHLSRNEIQSLIKEIVGNEKH